MFCQHCGVEVTHDRNYCTRCGGSLVQPGPQEVAPRPHVSAMSVWGIGATTFLLVVGGLVALFGFIFGMSQTGVTTPALVMMALLGSLTILGSAALMMRLWRLLLAGPHAQTTPAGPAQLPRPSAASELPPPRASALRDACDHVPSVTEDTTRTCDTAYREPCQR